MKQIGRIAGVEMRTETPIDQFLTTRDVAAILSLNPQTVIGWRRGRNGPPWVRIGQKAIRYRRNDLEAWIATGEAS